MKIGLERWDIHGQRSLNTALYQRLLRHREISMSLQKAECNCCSVRILLKLYMIIEIVVQVWWMNGKDVRIGLQVILTPTNQIQFLLL